MLSKIVIHQPKHLQSCIEAALAEGPETAKNLLMVLGKLASLLANADDDNQTIELFEDGMGNSGLDWNFVWRDPAGRPFLCGGVVYHPDDKAWRTHT